jgi:2-keto-4-pentenoate hydratase/2-oxohepta-3-ene-1,7-dioic acid hydratase in catechol pathway
MLGKTLDGLFPLGPHLVSADEVGDPQAMGIRCLVNGDVRQDSNTADMVFGVAELVAYISRHLTLEPGDVIATGTPQGVAQGRPDKPWLRPGDEVVVEIGGLGQLRNRMV